ncbi:hypothetical protein JOQ06_019295 [Pogonophryne albipinna]|uniref:BED-type domain-containing protein n=1 Tax=Pogonophryne albipinna TaxID=1090488 RepID=A0AAD6AR17_9TELE|nr:hypothetical protein JOQ06_019295 [Pogonophryne albipinna]
MATPKTKTSKVWDNFILDNVKKVVKCNICKGDLAWHGSTSSMMEHLKRKHVGVLEDDSTRPKRSCASPTAMDQYLQRKRPVSLQQATALTNSILTMLVKDMRPMSMVDGEGFREMIRQFNPEYILPSRTHFTHLMEKKYEATLLKVKETIKEVKSALTLTADVWTSRATEAYLGVSCHFISEDWEMKTLNLATMPLEERHSGVNIMTWLEEVIAKYDILPTKIKAVVHDNGSNIVAAMRMLEEKHGWASVRCSGHTLQLIVNNALKEPSISRAVGAARHLPDQWVLLEELTQGLQPFQCATVYLSGQEYATASCLPQLVKGLQRSTQQTRFETGAGKAFLASAEKGINERWGCLNTISAEKENPIVLSASLDPRFRKLKFMGAEDGTRVQGSIEVLAIKEVRGSEIQGCEQVHQQRVSVPGRGDKSALDNLLQSDTDSLSEEEDESHEDQKLQMARSEVQMYFAEPAIHKKDDPLRWWRENKGRFPVLSKLARSFLCIPATSTPSERIFSVAGNICSQKRASLSRDHVEMLTFLHFNPE